MKLLGYDRIDQTYIILPYSYRQKYLDTHVITLLHQLAIHQDLVCTGPVALIISRIYCFSNLAVAVTNVRELYWRGPLRN
jgi:hypothetical protein